MRHQDLQINHKLESWTYADATERTTATGFVGGDIGRVAYQSDTGQYWRLTDDSPVTWALIGPPTAVAPAAYASYQTPAASPLNPLGTASTTGVMMGMGSTAKITPSATGKVLITMSGQINNVTGTVTGCGVQIFYGTGTAPVNDVAFTGTAVGSQESRTMALASTVPFSCTGLVTGLAIGTQIWIDAVVVTTAGTATIQNVTVAAVELP